MQTMINTVVKDIMNTLVNRILMQKASNFLDVMNVLWEQPYIIVEKDGKWVMYSKELKTFFQIPSRLNRSYTCDRTEPFDIGGDFKWGLPDVSLFAESKFPFDDMANFLNKYDLRNDSVLNGDRYFWTSNKSVYNVYSSNSTYSLSSQTQAYIWPVFEVGQSVNGLYDFIDVVFKIGLKISPIENEDCCARFKKIIKSDHLNLNTLQIKKAKMELEYFRELGGDGASLEKSCSRIQMELLLECDKIRADIEPYDEKLLTDPNRGHWELWENEEENLGFVARNPRKDVRENGVVGIDFGTKSTVVVYQNDDERIMPMRVGTGELKKSLSREQYENPTIMELVSFDNFMKAYKEGSRPRTQWDDLKISHQANQDFAGSAANNRYGSFFANLKQWAGAESKKNVYVLCDQENKAVELRPYDTLNENDFDPIETYAYYLGLYINNMRNGIFLNYYLSFPVTYEKAVQKRIVKSFERGLKKSLPAAIVADDQLMQRFCVDGSISEPAAYAVCALQEYGFVPEDNKKVYYGIFDFGGAKTAWRAGCIWGL